MGKMTLWTNYDFCRKRIFAFLATDFYFINNLYGALII